MLDRPFWKLTLGFGLVSACSLTVPSEDEVFGSAGGSSSSSGSSSAGKGGTDKGGSGGTMTGEAGQGAAGSDGGQPQNPAAGSPSVGGMAPEGGGGADAGAGGGASPPMPTGEIVNPSFEKLGRMGWTLSPANSPAVYVQLASMINVEPVDGPNVLSFWDDLPYSAKIFQVVEGLEDGTYRLGVYSANKVSIVRANLYAKNCGGTDPEPVPLSGSGQALLEVAIEAVEVVGGKCEIGLDIEAAANDWANVDHFTFEKVVPK